MLNLSRECVTVTMRSLDKMKGATKWMNLRLEYWACNTKLQLDIVYIKNVLSKSLNSITSSFRKRMEICLENIHCTCSILGLNLSQLGSLTLIIIHNSLSDHLTYFAIWSYWENLKLNSSNCHLTSSFRKCMEICLENIHHTCSILGLNLYQLGSLTLSYCNT